MITVCDSPTVAMMMIQMWHFNVHYTQLYKNQQTLKEEIMLTLIALT